LKPQIEEQIDGYLFRWDDISIKAQRVNLHRDGKITGDITIQTTHKDYSPILMPSTQINFSAEQTRTRLIKNLNEKFAQFDWAIIIDELAHYVQQFARQGEPIKELWTYEDVQPPEYLLEPILFKGLPTVIFGEKGAHKSILSLVFYTCLILPWHDNPLGIKVPARSVKPLILDWESEANIVQYQAKKLQEGMGLPSFPIYYRRCILPLAADIEQIVQHKNEIGAQVVILDSLGAAAGGDLKAAETAMNFYTALRKLKTTALIIGQTSKDEESKRKSIFGSVYFTYYSRSIWELCKAEPVSDNDVNIALFHKWANLTALQKPIGFTFHYNQNKTQVERTPVNISEFRAKISASNTVLEILKQGALSANEIAEQTNSSTTEIRVALSRLKKKSKVIQLEDARWGLTTQRSFAD